MSDFRACRLVAPVEWRIVDASSTFVANGLTSCPDGDNSQVSIGGGFFGAGSGEK